MRDGPVQTAFSVGSGKTSGMTGSERRPQPSHKVHDLHAALVRALNGFPMSQAMSIFSRTTPTAAHEAVQVSGRDLRLDFFRGLALLMIFVDHVSGNQFAAVTLQSIGFADAAEVFVFIAGVAGVLAYRKAFLTRGFAEGCRAVFARIRVLYLAHVAMVAGVLLVALAAHLHGTEFDFIGKLGLKALLETPLDAMIRLPILGFMPNYLDILPLYIILLATLPLILVGQRIHVLLPLCAAGLSYAAAQAYGITLPNLGNAKGWFLNPFAWVLLFAAGATVARLTIDGFWSRLPRAVVAAVTFIAAAYVIFAFLYAEPWRVFPLLESFSAVNILIEWDKAFLSWHRLVDLLAKAWLVAIFIPRDAHFLSNGLGAVISRAGRNSLPVFISGTFLALVGSIILFEGDGAAVWQIIVTAGGVMALLAHAWWIDTAASARGFAQNNRKPGKGLPVLVPTIKG
jgi:hypothetical protein